jgi:PEP-CTERM motif
MSLSSPLNNHQPAMNAKEKLKSAYSSIGHKIAVVPRVFTGGLMRSAVRWLCALGLMAVCSTGSASAGTIVYDLNCELGSKGCTTLATSAGTVTLTDSGDEVDVTVFFSLATQSVFKLWLNYDDASFSNLSFVGLADENNQKADGYSKGKFDLELTAPGANNPYTFTLALTGGGNLDPEDFDFRDSAGLFFVGVQGNSPGDFNGSTVYSTSTPPDTSPVPEPGTLLLFGSGLIAAAARRRRTK